jgi:hypothetical protein
MGTGVQKERFKRLLDYGRDREHCRRKTLLSLLDYSGEAEMPEGFCCDVCEGKAGDLYREEKSVLDFFSRNQRIYTLSEAARALEQAGTIRWTGADAKEVIRHLLAAGKLKEGKSFLWKGRLSLKRQPKQRGKKFPAPVSLLRG